MIETKILSDAPGIQNQGLIDKTESTGLPAMTNGLIVGRFKRGRMDKAMVVTADNYQAVLGHDPSNPSYMALEDIFALGVGQVNVLRVGGGVGGGLPIYCTPTTLVINEYGGDIPAPDFSTGHHAKYRVNNGNWVTYVGGTSTYATEGWIPEAAIDAFEIFLGSISSLRSVIAIDGSQYNTSVPLIATSGMGSAMVEIFDDSGNFVGVADNVPVAFVFRKYPSKLLASPSDNDGNFDVSTVETTTIEFAPSERAGSIDLVTEMFGGVAIAMSCGFAVYQGY